mmetsp:Transcript_23544/g.41777  ORF Transcript_23544/g.41777 Transcript_23544/m.41777 type:complete len:224 (-) Transcript_23544:1195-1866(-)
MEKMSILRLYRDEIAWNVDGSSNDLLEESSWIQFWESNTGQQRGGCSFVGCNRPAQVGGHVWIQRRGVFIAPICNGCNYHGNVTRRQRGGSKLRQGTAVVRTEYTPEMQTAPRRYADEIRYCEHCTRSIQDQPESHTLCLSCFRNDNRAGVYVMRRCQVCRTDISERPPTHALCLDCFQSQSQPHYFSSQFRGRRCQYCGEDISNRPSNHVLCYDCYMEEDFY